jgi:hypothetical protein
MPEIGEAHTLHAALATTNAVKAATAQASKSVAMRPFG